MNKDSKTDNNLRTWVNFKIEPEQFLKYVKERNPKRVAILRVNLPSTQEEYGQLVIPPLKQAGIDVYDEAFEPTLQDFKDLAVKVQNYKPDLIIVGGFQNNLVGIVRAFRPLGLINKGNLISSYDMMDAAEILGKDELEDIRVVAPVFVTRPNQEQVRNWSDRFKAKFNRAPLYTDAYAYDMVTIIHDAAKRLNLPANSQAWIKAIRETEVQKGVTGPLKFDQDGSLITPLEVGVYRDGKLVPLNK